MPITQKIWAQHALTAEGWQSGVSVEIDQAGYVCGIAPNSKPEGTSVGILLPAMTNLHSHAFQRAMAGMTESRGPDRKGSFWGWRKLMYRFIQQLTPDDAEAIAAFGQMEMLESGYATVGEFHYLHHQSNGKPYTHLSEMSDRIVAAAGQSGIGLSLLPVLYEQGGCDGRRLTDAQIRFGNTLDAFVKLYDEAATLSKQHNRMNIGIAPHSLRAVSQVSLSAVHALAAGKPFHIHIAEQDAEVAELLSIWKARPVEWILANMAVDETWCLIHATQMNTVETQSLAKTGAVTGLCPITESNLGDGIFSGIEYEQHNGKWGIGTDSNVRISLSEELRTLEYSQRLRHKGRAMYADSERSTARVLYDKALQGGAQALQRKTGTIKVGQSADLLSLELDSTNMISVSKDGWLDAWIFAGDDRLICNLWSGGQLCVANGVHVYRDEIESRYRKVMSSLLYRL